jgi:hypothetical protein
MTTETKSEKTEVVRDRADDRNKSRVTKERVSWRDSQVIEGLGWTQQISIPGYRVKIKEERLNNPLYIPHLLERGYEFVTKEEVGFDITQFCAGDDQRIRIQIGPSSYGFLMKLKEEFYREDEDQRNAAEKAKVERGAKGLVKDDSDYQTVSEKLKISNFQL